MVRDIDETQAPLLDHLLELRTRLLRCVYAIAIAFVVCFYFANQISTNVSSLGVNTTTNTGKKCNAFCTQ